MVYAGFKKQKIKRSCLGTYVNNWIGYICGGFGPLGLLYFSCL